MSEPKNALVANERDPPSPKIAPFATRLEGSSQKVCSNEGWARVRMARVYDEDLYRGHNPAGG